MITRNAETEPSTGEIAEQIVGGLDWMDSKSLAPRSLAEVIEKALRDRDKRAARIVRSGDYHDHGGRADVEGMVIAIRGKS